MEKQKPIDDAISRQAALDTVDNLKIVIANNLPELIYKSSVLKLLHELPSVQPEQKVGHWIKKMVRGSEELYCSNCGNGIDVIYEYDYCPNCGCRMEESEDT